jgi:DNA-binding response OmpR family regulator
LQGRSVLIVDDDEDILSSIELAMRAEGATTSKAVDGHLAVNVFHANNPDAVVLDMMLPRRSGFLVLEKMMEQPDPPVVVMVTANQGKRHQEYAKNLGVHAYMTKPVSLHRLIETIAKLLEGRPVRTPPAPAVAGPASESEEE